MTIRISESAVQDLEDGRDFYEFQEAGLGRYFEDCLSSDIESLILYKGLQRKIFGHYRLLSKRFPFAIYYKIDDDGGVLIHRVLDCRSNPARHYRALR
ncbi:type II toxin-antitoxin system RelE/ParE family toxin [Verrucomicrobium sp. BvORR034]|uniref:type II toxin-antitoxin system RelE/ParE family toxin n=1 Tax=Verrucomicrobium sp. BvORR034 TaxID=1396418 RepID=UPI0006788342